MIIAYVFKNHMLAVMDTILASESFADVTLVCAGETDSDAATTIKESFYFNSETDCFSKNRLYKSVIFNPQLWRYT